jgi:hypothetical protein
VSHVFFGIHCLILDVKWQYTRPNHGRYYSPPVPSPFALSFLLTIFTPLSTALPFRGGAARKTAGADNDGDGGSGTRGNGGLILGGGAEGTAVLTVGCE